MTPFLSNSRRTAIAVVAIALFGLPTVVPATGATLSDASLAYVGPGAGLGAIGALLAVVGAVVIGIAGLVLYPLQLLRNRLRKKPEASGDAGSKAGSGA